MTDTQWAVLKSLAIRPNQNIVTSIEPMVTALLNAGYVTCGPDGWVATATGCELLEKKRTIRPPAN